MGGGRLTEEDQKRLAHETRQEVPDNAPPEVCNPFPKRVQRIKDKRDKTLRAESGIRFIGRRFFSRGVRGDDMKRIMPPEARGCGLWKRVSQDCQGRAWEGVRVISEAHSKTARNRGILLTIDRFK
jgi:hypothetical protein